MTRTPLSSPKNPLLKNLHVSRQSRMVAELMSRLQLHRLLDGVQTIRHIVRR